MRTFVSLIFWLCLAEALCAMFNIHRHDWPHTRIITIGMQTAHIITSLILVTWAALVLNNKL